MMHRASESNGADGIAVYNSRVCSYLCDERLMDVKEAGEISIAGTLSFRGLLRSQCRSPGHLQALLLSCRKMRSPRSPALTDVPVGWINAQNSTDLQAGAFVDSSRAMRWPWLPDWAQARPMMSDLACRHCGTELIIQASRKSAATLLKLWPTQPARRIRLPHRSGLHQINPMQLRHRMAPSRSARKCFAFA